MSDPTHRCKNRVYRRGTVGRCNKPATSPKCEDCQKARTAISEGILGIAKLLDEALTGGDLAGGSYQSTPAPQGGPKLGSRGDASQMQYTQCQQCMGRKDPKEPGKSCKKCKAKLHSAMDYDM
jgi:hypothetical protein